MNWKEAIEPNRQKIIMTIVISFVLLIIIGLILSLFTCFDGRLCPSGEERIYSLFSCDSACVPESQAAFFNVFRFGLIYLSTFIIAYLIACFVQRIHDNS